MKLNTGAKEIKQVNPGGPNKQPKQHMLWVLKKHLNEPVLLSTKNTCLN